MKKIKVIFFGCIDLSYTALMSLTRIKHVEVVGVVTKKTSPINSDFFPLETFCKKKKLDTFFFEPNKSKQLFDWVKEKRSEVILCIGWSHVINSSILSLPIFYSIGYHPSDLPKNRGRHPLIWSLVLGLTKTASTFFELNKNVDSGDIINKTHINIAKSDTINSLKKKLEKKIVKQIQEIFFDILKGKLKRKKQNNLLANKLRKRYFSDGVIDWRMNAEPISNLVRALVKPFPGASIYYNGNEFKVWMVEISNFSPQNTEPGKVLSVINKNIHVKCSDKSIIITKHNLKKMPKKGEYLL